MASLWWDCNGTIANVSTVSSSVISVEFTVDKTYNDRVCICSASHPIGSYQTTADLSLTVHCKKYKITLFDLIYSFGFNASFNNISVISRRSPLMEKAGEPRWNNRLLA